MDQASEIDTLVLLAGDVHFLDMIKCLMEKGVKVIIMGFSNSTSYMLHRYVDKTIFLDDYWYDFAMGRRPLKYFPEVMVEIEDDDFLINFKPINKQRAQEILHEVAFQLKTQNPEEEEEEEETDPSLEQP